MKKYKIIKIKIKLTSLISSRTSSIFSMKLLN